MVAMGSVGWNSQLPALNDRGVKSGRSTTDRKYRTEPEMIAEILDAGKVQRLYSL
jgi:hypothetical protein